MLIRVERVGNDQRDGRHIHADDVRDYLMRELNVPEEHIRKKTAVKDEIADEDLLSEYSAVRYILTKKRFARRMGLFLCLCLNFVGHHFRNTGVDTNDRPSVAPALCRSEQNVGVE